MEVDYRSVSINSWELCTALACKIANEVLKPEKPFRPGDIVTWERDPFDGYKHPLLEIPFIRAELIGEVYT